jgi:hypothetical protein
VRPLGEPLHLFEQHSAALLQVSPGVLHAVEGDDVAGVAKGASVVGAGSPKTIEMLA